MNHPEEEISQRNFCQTFSELEKMSNKLPELYSIHRAKVRSIQDYGVFAELEGSRVQGLVHISQICKSDKRLEGKKDIEGLVSVGDSIFVKVIRLDDSKISLSMKYVNQGDGTDLDENEIDLERDKQRKKPQSSGFSRHQIQIGAVLDTVCPKCKTKGHLASECYATGQLTDTWQIISFIICFSI